ERLGPSLTRLAPFALAGQSELALLLYGVYSSIGSWWQSPANVRFTPESGHQRASLGMSALCQERTLKHHCGALAVAIYLSLLPHRANLTPRTTFARANNPIKGKLFSLPGLALKSGTRSFLLPVKKTLKGAAGCLMPYQQMTLCVRRFAAFSAMHI